MREVFEETGLRADVEEVAYISESYDGAQHFLNVTFALALLGNESGYAPDDSGSAQGGTRAGDHVIEVAWVPLSEAGERIAVAVVREPLLAYLDGSLAQRYAGFHDAGVTIEWPDDAREPRGPELALERMRDDVNRLALHRGSPGQHAFLLKTDVP